MKWMRKVIEYGIKYKDVNKIFVQYHKPSYSRFKHEALAETNDPLKILREYKSKHGPSFDVFVFNSHNHTTELYNTEQEKPEEGVIVLVAGGGGAPQKICEECEPAKETPPELFWQKIGERHKRVNFFEVTVMKDTVMKDNVKMVENCLIKDSDPPEFRPAVEISSNGEVTLPIDREDLEECNLAISPEKP